MRIAFDHQIFCSQAYGGISRYIASLAGELDSLGQHVRIIAPCHRNNHLTCLPDGLVDGRRVKAYPPRTGRLLLQVNRLVATRRLKKLAPDILHETYFSQSRPRSAAITPVVITVHDMIGELFYGGSPAQRKYSEVKRSAVSQADHVICVSANTRRDVIELLQVPESKTSVVHLGVDEIGGVGARPTGGVSGKQFVLYVGKRGGYKNFRGFVGAFASSRRLMDDFDIVACGGGKFDSYELGMLKGLGFSPGSVRQVDGDDRILSGCYRGASALVYPSLYEGFGIPPLEAMAHNCPVVSSKGGSMPEVIGNAAEFFDPYSAEEMAGALESVLYSEERARQLKSAGMQVVKKYSWNRCAMETLDVYKGLV